MQSLTGDQRSSIIRTLADLLVERERDILLANQADVKALPEATGISTSIKGRLTLTSAKLKSVSDGLRQIADSSSSIVGRVTRRTLLSDGLELTKMTVPIGVLLVIFESRPDVLPQVCVCLYLTVFSRLRKPYRLPSAVLRISIGILLFSCFVFT